MVVVSLFVQEQRSRLNMFLHSRDEISQHQALLISNQFARSIQTNTKVRGDLVLLQRFRAIFVLLNEVYVVSVCYLEDYPFDAMRCCNNAKSLLFEACKGVEITVSAIYKKYGQVLLALEELLNESNTFQKSTIASEIVNKSKFIDIAPSTIGKTTSLRDKFGGKARNNTIKKIETNIETNINTNWTETVQNVDTHTKRFEVLAQFSFQTSEPPAIDEELLTQHFGHNFTAPDSEPRPGIRRRLSSSTPITPPRTPPPRVSLTMLDDNFNSLQPKLAQFEMLRVETDTDETTDSDSITFNTPTPAPIAPPVLRRKEDITAAKTKQPTSLMDLLDDIGDITTPPPKTLPPIKESIPNNDHPIILNANLKSSPVDVVPLQPTIQIAPKLPTTDIKPISAVKPVVEQPEITRVPRQPEIIQVPRQPEIIQVPRQPEITQVPRSIFDPSQILTKFENRAHVIPLKVVVVEKIDLLYRGTVREQYSLLGEIRVKTFSVDTHISAEHKFTLQLDDTQKLAKVMCNPKFCKQIKDNEYKFDCQIPSNMLSRDVDAPNASLTLIKYKLQENMSPLPLLLQPKFKLTDDNTVLNLMIRYKVNPSTPLKLVSMLVAPVSKELIDTGITAQAANSKPEGRWTVTQQRLLWRLEDLQPNVDDTLRARFKMSTNVESSGVQFVPGSVLIKFRSAEGCSFAGFKIAGDLKRNDAGEVFVGGCEYIIENGEKFEYILTADNKAKE